MNGFGAKPIMKTFEEETAINGIVRAVMASTHLYEVGKAPWGQLKNNYNVTWGGYPNVQYLASKEGDRLHKAARLGLQWTGEDSPGLAGLAWVHLKSKLPEAGFYYYLDNHREFYRTKVKGMVPGRKVSAQVLANSKLQMMELTAKDKNNPDLYHAVARRLALQRDVKNSVKFFKMYLETCKGESSWRTELAKEVVELSKKGFDPSNAHVIRLRVESARPGAKRDGRYFLRSGG